MAAVDGTALASFGLADDPENAAPADVCLLVEGTYPFVSGGVSSWVHDVICGHPELTFAVLYVGSYPGAHGEPRFKLPAERRRRCTACSARSRRSRRSTGPGGRRCASRSARCASTMDARPAPSRVLAGLAAHARRGRGRHRRARGARLQRSDAARAAARPRQLPAADDDRRTRRARCAVPGSVLALPRDLRAGAAPARGAHRARRAATTRSRPATRACSPRCGATAPAAR